MSDTSSSHVFLDLQDLCKARWQVYRMWDTVPNGEMMGRKFYLTEGTLSHLSEWRHRDLLLGYPFVVVDTGERDGVLVFK